MEKLTADEIRRNNVLEALTAAKDIEEASQTAGVSRKTIYSYMANDTEFITAYRNIKREQLRDITDRMTLGATKATDYILSLLDDEEAPPAVRLQASVKLLDLFAKFRVLEGAINAATYKENSLDIFSFDASTPSGL